MQAWVNIAAGLWSLLSGLFIVLAVPFNFFVTGIVIAVAGFWKARSWQGIANGVLGIFLFMSGFSAVLAIPMTMFFTGLVVFVFAVWRVYDLRNRPAKRVGT
ncbi:MAG: hypothetical protein ACLFVQ_07825 [Chitinispirillaceae bacterium]